MRSVDTEVARDGDFVIYANQHRVLLCVGSLTLAKYAGHRQPVEIFRDYLFSVCPKPLRLQFLNWNPPEEKEDQSNAT